MRGEVCLGQNCSQSSEKRGPNSYTLVFRGQNCLSNSTEVIFIKQDGWCSADRVDKAIEDMRLKFSKIGPYNL